MVGPTIKDIAREAGVSTNTVSRALNDKPDVSAHTRAHILSIAKRLNYSPNYLAKSLISKHTRTLGVVVTDNANPFYAQVIKGIEDTARRNGYNIILCNTNEESEREGEALNLLREKRVDGILITPVQKNREYLKALANLDIPFVLVNRHPREFLSDYVVNDNVAGGSLALGRLIGIGRRRLAYISGPATISSAQERLEGCRQAIAQKGSGAEVELIVKQADLKMEDGYRAMRDLLDREPAPDGVFAYSDLLAIGAMRAIHESGRRIPQDIALVGYDDIDFARYLEVPLTTVKQPRYRIGREAAGILIDKLEGDRKPDHSCIVLRPELVVRVSA